MILFARKLSKMSKTFQFYQLSQFGQFWLEFTDVDAECPSRHGQCWCKQFLNNFPLLKKKKFVFFFFFFFILSSSFCRWLATGHGLVGWFCLGEGCCCLPQVRPDWARAPLTRFGESALDLACGGDGDPCLGKASLPSDGWSLVAGG